MIHVPFDKIDETTIQQLVDNEVAEIKTLDYKRDLPGGGDEAKREFLADVTSFANASGGHIVFGVEEKKGAPIAANGVTCDDPDATISWLESVVREGIAPRIPNLKTKAITGFDKGPVFVMEIPKSWVGPHMVSFNKSSRFYTRTSNGKSLLDVQEIRNAFLATESQGERIRNFIMERIANIMGDETPVPLSSPQRLVLHLIPLPSFLNRERLALNNAKPALNAFSPLGSRGCDHRWNVDGYLNFRTLSNEDRKSKGYCQLFFDGAVENVWADVLQQIPHDVPGTSPNFIASVAYEKYCIEATATHLKGYQQLGLEPPFIVFLALLNCEGAYMSVRMCDEPGNPIDRKVVRAPEVFVDSIECDFDALAAILKPAFDAVWNACGFASSHNYNNEGNWDPPP